MISPPLSLLLYGQAAGLLALLYVFGAWVVLPVAVIWAFFRSAWAPQALKAAVGAVLGVAVLLVVGLVVLAVRHAREPADHYPPQPVRLTVRQAGLLPYPLGRGNIEQARFDTTRRLVVTGDLPTGRQLRAQLEPSPGFATPFETTTATVTAANENATQATGHATYDPSARTVTGSFQCVLPSGQRLLVSFPPTPVVLQGITP